MWFMHAALPAGVGVLVAPGGELAVQWVVCDRVVLARIECLPPNNMWLGALLRGVHRTEVDDRGAHRRILQHTVGLHKRSRQDVVR